MSAEGDSHPDSGLDSLSDAEGVEKAKQLSLTLLPDVDPAWPAGEGQQRARFHALACALDRYYRLVGDSPAYRLERVTPEQGHAIYDEYFSLIDADEAAQGYVSDDSKFFRAFNVGMYGRLAGNAHPIVSQMCIEN